MASTPQKKKSLRSVSRADLRRLRGFQRQVDFAEHIGVPQGSVSRIENEYDPRVTSLRRFLDALDGELLLVARFDDLGDFALELPTRRKIR